MFTFTVYLLKTFRFNLSFGHLCPHISVAHHYTSLQVTEQVMDEKIGRIVTRVVLPRVVMHSRHHYAVFLLEHLLYNSSVIFFHFHIAHVLRQKLQQMIDERLIGRHSQEILLV